MDIGQSLFLADRHFTLAFDNSLSMTLWHTDFHSVPKAVVFLDCVSCYPWESKHTKPNIFQCSVNRSVQPLIKAEMSFSPDSR